MAIYLAGTPVQSSEPSAPYVRIIIREELLEGDTVASDNTVEGWADLTFPRAGRVAGNFRAQWLPPVQYCL